MSGEESVRTREKEEVGKIDSISYQFALLPISLHLCSGALILVMVFGLRDFCGCVQPRCVVLLYIKNIVSKFLFLNIKNQTK